MTLIAGVDDAGRGPVIGPLVVAGVLIQDHQTQVLEAVGVRDSKSLTPNRRRSLARKIKELSIKYKVLEISPKEIDEVVLSGRRLRKLNWLEAKAMAEVIKALRPNIAYVDASDVLEKRFGDQIRGMIPFNAEVISEHHADEKYPVVSAASILAKTHRDEVVSDLRRRYGDFGSGYSSDPKTRRFLFNWLMTHRSQVLPCFVRKSWKTLAKLRKELEGASKYWTQAGGIR